MQAYQAQLPGGYFNEQGICQHNVALRAMTGRDEELLANRQLSSARAVSEILAQCVQSIGNCAAINLDQVRSLLVADRQYLMLMLRKYSLGDKVQAVIRCSNQACLSKLDIDFNISEIPITSADVQAEYKMELNESDCNLLKDIVPGIKSIPKLSFRLPNGCDQEWLAEQDNSNDISAMLGLLARCITSIGKYERPGLKMISALPSSIRSKIEFEMEARAPNLELTMDMQCPECGNNFDAPFDIQDFFYNEVSSDIHLLHREVHHLAFHYHWSEEDIMAMSRPKRQRYINILNEEIERINDAME